MRFDHCVDRIRLSKRGNSDRRHVKAGNAAALVTVQTSKLMIPAQVFATPSAARILSHPFSLFYRMWPVAAGVALIFNVVWIGFHGFELFKLIF